MQHYLYRHIRLDKNEPFYIGIGTKTNCNHRSYEGEYRRAFSKSRLDSKIWKIIVKKTEYKVEILFESNNYQEIKNKEIEFIKLYGRIDKKTGTLANMTDGGDGTIGWVPSEENIQNMRNSNKNRVYTHGNIIYQYDLEGNFIKEWVTIQEASTFIKVCKSNLSKIIKYNKNGNFCKGFYWTNFLSDKIEPKKYRDDFTGKIVMIDSIDNSIIKEFKTKRSALIFIEKKPKNQGALRRAIQKNTTYCNYKWKEVNR